LQWSLIGQVRRRAEGWTRVWGTDPGLEVDPGLKVDPGPEVDPGLESGLGSGSEPESGGIWIQKADIGG